MSIVLDRNANPRPEEALRLLRSLVENNREIFGAAIAFDPMEGQGRSTSFAPYFCKSNVLRRI